MRPIPPGEASESACGSQMCPQTLQFFLDVGFGGKEHRLLVKTKRIEGLAGLDETGDLLCEFATDGLDTARRRRFDARDEAFDLVELRVEHRLEAGAFLEPGGDKAIESSGEARQHGLMAGGDRVLTFRLLHQLEHALERQQGFRRAVEAIRFRGRCARQGPGAARAPAH